MVGRCHFSDSGLFSIGPETLTVRTFVRPFLQQPVSFSNAKTPPFSQGPSRQAGSQTEIQSWRGVMPFASRPIPPTSGARLVSSSSSHHRTRRPVRGRACRARSRIAVVICRNLEAALALTCCSCERGSSKASRPPCPEADATSPEITPAMSSSDHVPRRALRPTKPAAVRRSA